MPAKFSQKQFSVAFDDQTSYDTADGSPSWTWLVTSFPSISFEREIEDLDLAVSGGFQENPKKVGAKSGSVTFSCPLRSQVSGYDPSSGSPALNPEMALIKDFLGASTTGTYAASEIAASGSDGNTWEVTAATPAPGDCYAVGSTTAITTAGWVASRSGTTVELVEDTPATPSTGEDIIPTVTIYGDATASPTPRTLRITGSDSSHDIRLIGCMPQRMSLSMTAGDIPTVEFTFTFTDWSYESSGGFNAATDYTRLPPVLGAKNGRVKLGGVSNGTGTPDSVGTCGLGDMSLTIELEQTKIPCHSAQQGVSEVIITDRKATVTTTVPHESTWIASNNSTWEASLENGTPSSFSLQVGSVPGQFFALLIPAGVVSAQPSYGSVYGDIIGWTIEAKPAAYSGDGSSSNAGNSLIRLAVG